MSARRLAVVLATGMSYPFFQNAHLVLTDIVFAPLFWVVLYCLIRLRRGSYAWGVLAGLATGAALCRPPAGGGADGPDGAGAAGGALGRRRRQERWSAVVIGAVTILVAGGFYLWSRSVGNPRPCYMALHLEPLITHVTSQPLRLLGQSLEPFLKTMGELLTSQHGRVVAWAVSAPS